MAADQAKIAAGSAPQLRRDDSSSAALGVCTGTGAEKQMCTGIRGGASHSVSSGLGSIAAVESARRSSQSSVLGAESQSDRDYLL